MISLTPKDIKLRQKSKLLELIFEDGRRSSFSYEFLRVHSPSAEVRGHSLDQAVLQLNKVSVGISRLDLVGSYALKITFDDGHDTGLYSWEYFKDLEDNQHFYWTTYLENLRKKGHDRKIWVKEAEND